MKNQKPSPSLPPSPYLPPNKSETEQYATDPQRETTNRSRPEHPLGCMLLASFAGGLPLFALLVVINAVWDGYGILEYSKTILEFMFINGIVSVVIVSVLASVKVRYPWAALGFGCFWPVLLVIGILLFAASSR